MMGAYEIQNEEQFPLTFQWQQIKPIERVQLTLSREYLEQHNLFDECLEAMLENNVEPLQARLLQIAMTEGKTNLLIVNKLFQKEVYFQVIPLNGSLKIYNE